MKESSFPYQFIAIEGNIGAGKTTLCKRIAEQFGRRLILEQFTDNPFLPFFYENPNRYAFPVELFFMTERHKQLEEELAQMNLFEEAFISDYFFLKTLLFAKNNLKDDEFRLFQRLFEILNNTFPKPDLLVYVHRPVPILLQHIEKRNRQFEKRISPAYLERIQHTYFEYLRGVNEFPVLIIDAEEADFENNPEHYNILVDSLFKTYRDGMNLIRILN